MTKENALEKKGEYKAMYIEYSLNLNLVCICFIYIIHNMMRLKYTQISIMAASRQEVELQMTIFKI